MPALSLDRKENSLVVRTLAFSREPASRAVGIFCALVVLVLLLASRPSAAQTYRTGEIKGTVTDSSKPLAGATVVLGNVYAGKNFKIKTDDFGGFAIADAPYGYYEVEVVSAEGERLLEEQISIMPAGSARTATVKIDVSQSKTTSTPPNDPETFGGIRTLPEPNNKNKRERGKEIQKQNERISEMNTLILQANAAMLEKRWQDALAPLQELTGIEPDNWEYFFELGNAQYGLGQYQEAIGSYETGILNAGDVSGIDEKTADAESVRKKNDASRMLNNEGVAYDKLHKTKQAIEAYTKSAALAADPSLAYFNLCVMQYNLKNVEGTLTACDKAISVDPGKAEAYYFKGALLVYVNQPAATGKVSPPPTGTVETLKKYLELAPDGEHAAEVREMLNYLAALTNAAAGNAKKN
jgi:tetratricopeptide (TPR) repeat protein